MRANMSLLQTIRCCMLVIYYSKVILSCAYIFLLQAIRCYVLIINCSKLIFYQVLIFPCSSLTLLCPYELQKGNLLSCANNFHLQAMRRCHLTMSIDLTLPSYASINDSYQWFKNFTEKLHEIIYLGPKRRWYQLLPKVQAVLKYRSYNLSII